MGNINSVNICGRLTRDPEMKTLSSGTEITSFSIATNFFAGKGKEDGVSYIECYAWSGLAKIIAKHFGKGQKIFVTGELRQDRWEKDGVKQSRIRVMVNGIEFMDSKQSGDAPKREPKKDAQDVADDMTRFADTDPGFADDDTVPF